MERKRRGILFCLVGPAGSGKTTLARRLLEEPGVKANVSVTSRKPRPSEADGKSYHFIDRASFEARARAGEFFEWEEIHGNLYGTLKSSVSAALDSGIDLLLVIDIKGAVNFKKAYPHDAVICFVMPPAFSAIRDRIVGRGSVDTAELERRLKTAADEYAMLTAMHSSQDNQIDYLLINDDMEEAQALLGSILHGERMRFSRIENKFLESLGKGNI